MENDTKAALARLGAEAALHALKSSDNPNPQYDGILFARFVYEGDDEENRRVVGKELLRVLKEHIVAPLNVDYFDAAPLYIPNGHGSSQTFFDSLDLCMQAADMATMMGATHVEKQPGLLFVRMVLRSADQEEATNRVTAVTEAIQEHIIDSMDAVVYGDCFHLLAAEAFVGREDGEVRGPASGLPDPRHTTGIVSFDEEGMVEHDNVGDLLMTLQHLLEGDEGKSA